MNETSCHDAFVLPLSDSVDFVDLVREFFGQIVGCVRHHMLLFTDFGIGLHSANGPTLIGINIGK